jgi:hypothetical protein
MKFVAALMQEEKRPLIKKLFFSYNLILVYDYEQRSGTHTKNKSSLLSLEVLISVPVKI